MKSTKDLNVRPQGAFKGNKNCCSYETHNLDEAIIISEMVNK